MANVKVLVIVVLVYVVNEFCFLVCVKFLAKFYQRLEEKGVDKSNTEVVETQLMKFCKETRDDKEERFVSYPRTPSFNCTIAIIFC